MKLRLSNSNGTIEAEGTKEEVSSALSVLSRRILGLTLSAVEVEALRSGDTHEQVSREEVPPPPSRRSP